MPKDSRGISIRPSSNSEPRKGAGYMANSYLFVTNALVGLILARFSSLLIHYHTGSFILCPIVQLIREISFITVQLCSLVVSKGQWNGVACDGFVQATGLWCEAKDWYTVNGRQSHLNVTVTGRMRHAQRLTMEQLHEKELKIGTRTVP